MVKKYIPNQGDIIFGDFGPSKGHEQKGERPAVVVSNDVMDQFSNMIYICPITSNMKDFPTHYILEDSLKIKGSVLCEQMKSIDYQARNIKFVEKLSENDLLSIITLVNACIEN